MVSHRRFKLVDELGKEGRATTAAPVYFSQKICFNLGISLVLGDISSHLDGNDAGTFRPNHATEISEAELLLDAVLLYFVGLHDTTKGTLAQFIHNSVLIAKNVASFALIEL